MHWADEVRIETPEQIDVALEVAGLGSRFVAQVIDWAIKWGILAAVSLLVFVLLTLAGVGWPDKTPQVLLLTVVVTLFYSFLLGFDLYYELRHNGQTPGKKRAGIRVLREGGGPLDLRSACVRNLLGLADFLPVFYLLGGLIALLTPRSQRLGDLAAGTLVIRERATAPPADLDQLTDGLASDEFPFTPDQLRACTAADRQILRSYFQRYRGLDRQARAKLACQLAGMFWDKIGYQAAPQHQEGYVAEVFLASLLRALSHWDQHDR